MRRYEAVILLAVAALLIVAGTTWQFGPWGLIGSGLALSAAALAFDVKE